MAVLRLYNLADCIAALRIQNEPLQTMILADEGHEPFECSSSEANEFVQSIATCDRFSRAAATTEPFAFGFDGIRFGNMWGEVMRAVFAREELHGLFFVNCGLDIDDLGVMAECLEKTSHVRSLRLYHNPGFTDFTVHRLARAAVKHTLLKRFQLVENDEIRVGPLALQALASLRQRMPGIIVGGGESGKWLDGLIAMTSIVNPIAEEDTQKGQMAILKLIAAGSDEKAAKALEHLKKTVTLPEQNRILALLRQLIDKYSLIGGFELMATLPKDFDKYKGECPWTQYAAPSLAMKSKEFQVRFLLAVAKHKQNVLELLCSHVEKAIADLSGVTSDYLVPATVDAFLEKHNLSNRKYELQGVSLTFASEDFQKFNGRYKHSGFAYGNPCYVRDKDGCTPKCVLSTVLAVKKSGRCWLLREEDGGREECSSEDQELGDGTEWIFFAKAGGSHKCSVEMTTFTHEGLLRDKLVGFLQQRIGGSKALQLLQLGKELMRIDIGPPKSFARAMDKGEPDQLKDLNRCTFCFDSPTVLVVAFHLASAKVADLGGEISRVSNMFIDSNDFSGNGGTLRRDFSAPPVVHMFVRIKGWTFEMMFGLVDVMKAKVQLHKFYDINRAEMVEEVLMPVFDACHDFELPSSSPVCGGGMSAARSLS